MIRHSWIFNGMAWLMMNLYFAGCQSEPPIPPPQEFINLPVYTAAQQIPADSQEKYMTNPVLRAYAIGRYIDPTTKTVMHEEHTIYRMSKAPEWNLIPQPDAEPLRQPEISGQERYADIMAGQINRAANDLEAARREVAELLARQQNDGSSLDQFRLELEELQKRYAVIVENLQKTSDYVNRLEQKISKPKAKQPEDK